MESPEESPEESPDEHQGDLIVLQDVKVRLDGYLICEVDAVARRLEHQANQYSTPAEALNYMADFQMAFVNAQGSSAPGAELLPFAGLVPIPISRYCIIDVDIDPTLPDATGQIMSRAYQRVQETLSSGSEEGGERRWWYNSNMEGHQLGIWAGDCLDDIEPRSFEPTQFQVYNFSDNFRNLKVQESGSFEDQWKA